MINIFDYTDFKLFLREYYDFKKKENSKFSYRVFSQKAGISNPGYYIDIVKGRRILTEVNLEKIMKGLGLEENEKEYFSYLVKYQQSTIEEEKSFYHKKIFELKDSSGFRNVNIFYKKYYSMWYCPIIRNIIAIEGFNGDYANLAQKIMPKISFQQAQEAVEALLDMGLVVYDENSESYTVFDMKIRPDVSLKPYVREIQKEWIKKAVWAIDNISPDERNISSLTLSIDNEDVKMIIDNIDEFRKFIGNMSKSEKKVKKLKSKIYQLNIQFFPQSEAVG